MSTDPRLARLADLYERIHAHAAPRDHGDTALTMRRPVPQSLNSRLFLLAQGLAQSTQRVTGYPYRLPRGLSPAGRRLDDLLAPLGHTIDHRLATRQYAYHTDVVPWYPGKAPDGKDVQPTREEIEECWHFVEEEMLLVEPVAVICLGRHAARAFLDRYGEESIGRSKPPLDALAGRAFRAQAGGRALTTVVVCHPSAAYGALAQTARRTFEGAQRILQPLTTNGA